MPRSNLYEKHEALNCDDIFNDSSCCCQALWCQVEHHFSFASHACDDMISDRREAFRQTAGLTTTADDRRIRTIYLRTHLEVSDGMVMK